MTDEWAPSENADSGDFDIPTDGYDSSDLGSGGETVDREGWYHFEIADVVPELDAISNSGNEKTPAVRFDLLVLHTTDGQSPKGSRHFHRLYVGQKGGGPAKEGSVKSNMRFCLGLGLMKEIDKGGKKIAVDSATGEPKISMATLQRAKGMQCVAKIVKRKDDDSQFEIPFSRVHSVHSPEVSHVPKDMAAVALAGPPPAAGKQGGESQQQPTQAQQPASQPAQPAAQPQQQPPAQAPAQPPAAEAGGLNWEAADL